MSTCRVRTLHLVLVVLFSMTAATGCGDDDGQAAASVFPYGDDQTVVVRGDERTVIATPDGGDCLSGASGCVRPQDTCGDGGSALVVLDDAGELVRVVCYPDSETAAVIDTRDDNIKEVPAGTLILLDEVADGDDVDGDVHIKTDDVTVAGFGPDVSRIDGNFKSEGNHTTLSGVRITGNVELHNDGATLIDCVIEGNLHIKDAGALVQGCTIFGNVDSEGHDAVLLDNLARGTWKTTAAARCENNRAVTDPNGDLIVQPEEIGEPLSCP